jgi:hypothetical protein
MYYRRGAGADLLKVRHNLPALASSMSLPVSNLSLAPDVSVEPVSRLWTPLHSSHTRTDTKLAQEGQFSFADTSSIARLSYFSADWAIETLHPRTLSSSAAPAVPVNATSLSAAFEPKLQISPEPNETLAVQMFNRLVELKVITASVAMHLSSEWRTGLFAQLDDLIDPDNWEVGDSLPTSPSFNTFIRMISHSRPKVPPSLGATHDGNILAGWVVKRDRLTIESLPDDTVRWTLTCFFGDEKLAAAGKNPVNRLRSILAPYAPERWFG